VEPGDVSLNGAAAIVLVESGAAPLSGSLSERPVGPGEVIFVTGDEMELSVSATDTSLWVVHPARSED
jgi:mannose-6-phosphate isomerase class I